VAHWNRTLSTGAYDAILLASHEAGRSKPVMQRPAIIH
jgi:hypothetical protein